MNRLARLVVDYLRHCVGFLLASTGVAALVTFVLPFVGYATYGDRPGPGWYGPPASLSWRDVGTLAEYALVLPIFGAVSVAIYFVVPYAAVRLLEHRGLGPLAVRVVGGLLSAVVAWVVIGGAGWYIALGAVAGSAGVLGGLLYGAFRLPRRSSGHLPATLVSEAPG